jgi:putative MATE family efflux protein
MVTAVLVSLGLVAVLIFAGVPLVAALNGVGPGETALRRGISDYMIPSLLSYPALAIVSVGCGVLRGSGDTRTPMTITVAMSVLNALLAALLIHGLDVRLLGLHMALPGLKVAGAALALLISRTVGAALIAYVLCRGQRVIRLRFRGFRFHSAIQRSLLAIGLPMTAESVLFQVGKVITGIIVFSCGTAHMNANIISGSIFTLICIPGNAFAVASMPLVGQSAGRGDFADAREKMLYVNLLSSLGLLITCAAMALLAGPLVSLYTQDADVAALAVSVLYIVAVFVPLFWSVSFVLPAGLKGAGDVKYTMITSIIGMWLFRVLLGYLLGIQLGMGVAGVYLGMCADWAVRGVLYYIRVRGSRWWGKVRIATLPHEPEQADL